MRVREPDRSDPSGPESAFDRGDLSGATLREGWLAGPADGPAAELGRYRLGRELGVGGFGVVYEAEDPALGRRVAIKFVRHRGTGDDAALRLEAQALARMQHPNVVPVFDVGRWGDRLFLVMQYVEGETLAAWLGRRPPRADIVATFLAAGRGLAAAHAAGVVHCDFKPTNVLIGTDGSVKVADFGLSRWSIPDDAATAGAAEGDEDRTPRHICGTPRYMSPEQHRGLPIDCRSDVYSFALALLEALRGGDLLPQRSPLELYRVKCSPAFLELPELPGVSATLERALVRALAPVAADRFADLGAMLEAVTAPHVVRRWIFAGLGATAVVAALVGLAPGPSTRPDAVATASVPVIDGDASDELALADQADLDGALEAAIAHGARAYELAWSAHDHDVAAVAATKTFRRVSDAHREAREAEVWHDRAEGALRTVAFDHPAWHDYDEAVFNAAFASGQTDLAWPALTTMLLRAQLDPIDGARAWVVGLQFEAEMIAVAGDLPRAEAQAMTAVSAAREAFGNDDAETGAALLAAAIAAIRLGDGERALRQVEAAGEIYARLMPPDHMRMIQYCLVEGAAWGELGQYATGFASLRRARELQRRWAPAAQGLAAHIDGSAGSMAARMGELDLARELQYAALVEAEAELGVEHPQIAPRLHNLAVLEQRAGDCAKARKFAARADRIYASAFAADHPHRRGLAATITCDAPEPAH